MGSGEKVDFHGRFRSAARRSGYNDGKLDSQVQPHQPLTCCPQCTSQRVWRDGVRKTGLGDVQRYLCRDCGFRFSEPAQGKVKVNVSGEILEASNPMHDPSYVQPVDFLSSQKRLNDSALPIREDVGSQGSGSPSFSTVGKVLNICVPHSRERRVSAEEAEAKNLAAVELPRGKAGAGATLDVKGYLVNYEAKMMLKGLKPKTILRRLSVLRLLMKRGADLLNPESVFKAIDHAKRYNHATGELLDREWTDGSKNNAAQAYKTFCEAVGIQIPKGINFDKWSRRQQKLPWIPLETEIDQLIAGCSRKIAAFLQLIKETWCRSGEAICLEWRDVDSEHNIVTINSPEKNGLPRQFKVSSKLIAMLNALPKTSPRVFGASTLTRIRRNFITQRARIAHKLQNPRINSITFHTLRHWGATMEYHRTKDILHVQERLGHRSITSTLVYTHLVNFEDDEYHTATAKSLKEDEELIKAGFEYVTERDGVKIYRKRR